MDAACLLFGLGEQSETMLCNHAKIEEESDRLAHSSKEAKGEKEGVILVGEGEHCESEVRFQGEILMEIREIERERTVRFVT